MATPTQPPQTGIIRGSGPPPPAPVPTQKNPRVIHVKIRTREKVLFDGDAKAISSNNEKGNFDVLGKHANFISLIKNFLVIHKLDGSKEEIKIDNGLIQVVDNEVLVFIGIVNMSFLSQELHEQSSNPPVPQAPPPPTPAPAHTNNS